MGMFAYIYLRNLKKFTTVASCRIENFEYEKNGHQSRDFAKRIFMLLPELGKIKEKCQILVVGNTGDAIQEFLRIKRPLAPKVDDDDEVSLSSCGSQQKNAKALNKVKKIQMMNAAVVSSQAIVEKSKSTEQKTHGDDVSTRTDLSDPDSDDGDENGSVKGRAMRVTDIVEENKMLHQELLRITREKDNLNRERIMMEKEYKNVLLDLNQPGQSNRQGEAHARNNIPVNNIRGNDISVDNIPENNDADVEDKYYPPILCVKSGIQARADAVETAYTKIEPPKFYAHMCYAAWGFKTLAKRKVKDYNYKDPQLAIKFAEKMKRPVLTPKKKRVVRAHFRHFLKHYKFPPCLFRHYANKENAYAHRAITNAEIHMAMVDNEEEEAQSVGVDMIEL